MCRYLANPVKAGIAEGGVGVEAARNGVVDNGLLLLVEEFNQFTLGPDSLLDALGGVIQIPHNSRLLIGWGNEEWHAPKVIET